MSKFRVSVIAVAAGLVLGLAGCGSSSKGASTTTGSTGNSGNSQAPKAATTTPAASAPAATSAATITIKSFAFGSPLTVKPGATVDVVNEDSAPHTVTADDGKSFDASAAAGGGKGSFTAPTKPGTYAFHCSVHPMMHGTLIVAA